MPQSKTVVAYSGGMDSTVLLYHLRDAGHEVRAISFNYGQRHVREIEAARQICAAIDVPHVVADLSAINPLLGDNSLSGRTVEIPHGHYAEESMKLTVVPNRNMIMLSIAIGWAISSQFDAVAYGAHSGDHAIYPDCRPQFADAMDRAARLCDWREIKLLRPLVEMNKGAIAMRGHELGVPLAVTWTCYQGGEKHCGKCGACTERREAFAHARLADPTDYQ